LSTWVWPFVQVYSAAALDVSGEVFRLISGPEITVDIDCPVLVCKDREDRIDRCLSQGRRDGEFCLERLFDNLADYQACTPVECIRPIEAACLMSTLRVKARA